MIGASGNGNVKGHCSGPKETKRRSFELQTSNCFVTLWVYGYIQMTSTSGV